MKTGHAASALWLLLGISGSLATLDISHFFSGLHPPASEKSVRQSQSLSEGEQQFVLERERIVQEALSKLGINSSVDAVPRIAVLGSGGGERAAVGMLGSLSQMEKEGLLDAVLYMAGVSGATWTMASLYRDPQWSKNMDEAEERLLGSDVDLEEALSWLEARSKDRFFSLSDVWGLMTSVAIMKQMELRQLSDEASRNASNPYPIYNSVEKVCYNNRTTEGSWFEVTPHEAGFIDLGVFVNTSLLGSKFDDGVLKLKRNEMDMTHLQGILGSALADLDIVAVDLPLWFKVDTDPSDLNFVRVYQTFKRLLVLSRRSAEDDEERSDLDNLQRIIDDQLQRNHSRWLQRNTGEEREAFSRQRTLELLEAVGNWSDSVSARSAQRATVKGKVAFWRIIRKTASLLKNWEWGTTANYLHKYKGASIPECLSQDRFYLIDAGWMNNIPYPPFLGDRRDIDLIIAFDFIGGPVFQTLIQAREYAAKVNKSFPALDLESLTEIFWPKDFYVFGGEEESDLAVVYIPLFNRNNTKNSADFVAQLLKYRIFELPYSQARVRSELQVAKDNVRNTREALVAEINKAALRRRRKQGKV